MYNVEVSATEEYKKPHDKANRGNDFAEKRRPNGVTNFRGRAAEVDASARLSPEQ